MGFPAEADASGKVTRRRPAKFVLSGAKSPQSFTIAKTIETIARLYHHGYCDITLHCLVVDWVSLSQTGIGERESHLTVKCACGLGTDRHVSKQECSFRGETQRGGGGSDRNIRRSRQGGRRVRMYVLGAP